MPWFRKVMPGFLQKGPVPSCLKKAAVKSLLKKYALDPNSQGGWEGGGPATPSSPWPMLFIGTHFSWTFSLQYQDCWPGFWPDQPPFKILSCHWPGDFRVQTKLGRFLREKLSPWSNLFSEMTIHSQRPSFGTEVPRKTASVLQTCSSWFRKYGPFHFFLLWHTHCKERRPGLLKSHSGYLGVVQLSGTMAWHWGRGNTSFQP